MTTVEDVSALTEWLRTRHDDRLRDLLTARPDLLHPVPADIDALAQRAATRASVTRALDRLDRSALRVVEALAVLSEATGSVPSGNVRAAFPDGEEPPIDEPVATLRRLALVWDEATGSSEDAAGADDTASADSSEPVTVPDGRELRLVPTAHAILVQPAGLGPPAGSALRGVTADRLRTLLSDLNVTLDGFTSGGPPTQLDLDPGPAADALGAYLSRPDVLEELLRAAGDEARQVLDRLVWGPPFGTVGGADRPVRLASASSPVEQLLTRGLLVPVDGDTVVLPREVALHLRGGLLFRQPEPPPPLEVRDRGAATADRTAAGQAFTAVRIVEELLELWGAEAPPVLRAGGLGVRELRRTARQLDVPENVAALHVEVAYFAGLVGADSGVDGEWRPTKAYDVWSNRSTQQRWATLVTAWLDSPRAAGLVGERDAQDKPINALGQGVYRGDAPELRRRVLGLLGELPAGQAPTEETLRERLGWLRPRRWTRSRERLATWTLAEAETLGVTGLGALAAHGRALVEQGPSEAIEALAPLLPEPVDHVLVQPDLTAVAPGPLVRELSRELTLAADVESTGGATVYRFTRDSVRRALDAGRTAGDLIALLERHSRTEIPQPLRYLVDDVARAHGRIRVGAASAYVRCDDPGTLNELLADRRARGLGLRRLADTVLASRTGRQELLERLRALGYAPMAESAEGELLLSREPAHRSESRNRPPQPGAATGHGSASDDRLAVAAVRALRAGDRAATATRRPIGDGPGERPEDGDPYGVAGGNGESAARAGPPRSPAASTVAALRAASETRRQLWIGYLDAQGRASSRIVEPVRVEGGFLTAYDSTREAVLRFALHRLTGVAALDEADSA